MRLRATEAGRAELAGINLCIGFVMGQRDVFPRTERTWIGARLQAGSSGRADVNRHVMEVYAWPLQVYFRGTSSRWLGEPDDVVQGFFASRLDRDDFFSSWLTSGMRLRRWLMNGFSFYLSEMRKARRRDQKAEPLAEEPPVEDASVQAEMDRAFAIAIVRRALDETRAMCEGRGLEKHWQVFEAHYGEERKYPEIAADLGLTPVRAATMARTVAARFRTVLRDLLVRDGASPDEVDEEIETLLGVTAP